MTLLTAFTDACDEDSFAILWEPAVRLSVQYLPTDVIGGRGGIRLIDGAQRVEEPEEEVVVVREQALDVLQEEAAR